MNRMVHYRTDGEDAPFPEYPMHPLHGFPRELNMLQRLEAEDSAHRSRRKIDFVKVENHINPIPRSEIRSDIGLAGEEWAKIGNAILSWNLIRSEFINRTGEVQGLGTYLRKISN